MNQETANYIMQRMSKYLDNSQMIKLKDTLEIKLEIIAYSPTQPHGGYESNLIADSSVV